MSSLMKINFSESEDIRTPEKTKMSVVSLGGHTASKLEVAPGWKWSECIKPHVGTESCQKSHVGYIESGHLHVVSDDGSMVDVKAGDFYVAQGMMLGGWAMKAWSPTSLKAAGPESSPTSNEPSQVWVLWNLPPD